MLTDYPVFCIVLGLGLTFAAGYFVGHMVGYWFGLKAGIDGAWAEKGFATDRDFNEKDGLNLIFLKLPGCPNRAHAELWDVVMLGHAEGDQDDDVANLDRYAVPLLEAAERATVLYGVLHRLRSQNENMGVSAEDGERVCVHAVVIRPSEASYASKVEELDSL